MGRSTQKQAVPLFADKLLRSSLHNCRSPLRSSGWYLKHSYRKLYVIVELNKATFALNDGYVSCMRIIEKNLSRLGS